MTKPPAQPFPIIYHDRDSLYLEFASHALRFPFTEGGLHKALRHIPSIRSAPGYIRPGHQGNITPKLGPKLPRVAKATARKRELNGFSEEAKQGAAEIIRKLGIGD